MNDHETIAGSRRRATLFGRMAVRLLAMVVCGLLLRPSETQAGNFVLLTVSAWPAGVATPINPYDAFIPGTVLGFDLDCFRDVNPDYEFEGWYRDGDLVASWPYYTFTITRDTHMVALFVLREQVSAPTLSPSGGAFEGTSVEVTVSCATAGARIRYTTNGTDPTTSSSEVGLGGKVTVPIPGTLKGTSNNHKCS